jgi:uncharacterized membrane protein YkvA (DUF1232 family)
MHNGVLTSGREESCVSHELRRGLSRAKKAAEAYAQDPERSGHLLEEAQRKAERRRGVFGSLWEDFTTALRLLRSWRRRRYTNVPWRTVVALLGALIYFVNPLDVVPDALPIVGYLDDATIVAWVLHSVRGDLRRFRRWEEAAGD